MRHAPIPPPTRENPAEAMLFVVALVAIWSVVLASYGAWAGLLP